MTPSCHFPSPKSSHHVNGHCRHEARQPYRRPAPDAVRGRRAVPGRPEDRDPVGPAGQAPVHPHARRPPPLQRVGDPVLPAGLAGGAAAADSRGLAGRSTLHLGPGRAACLPERNAARREVRHGGVRPGRDRSGHRHDPARAAAYERAERPGPGRDFGCAAEVSADPGVRAVVLYGGPKVFAAGADIKEMADASYRRMAADSRRLQGSFTAVAKIPKPVVAAITGYALGGGLELALCADFRVAGQGAQVGQPEILLGIIPGAGGTQRLPRLVGPARAKDIVFTGRFVGAAEALDIGLVDRVVPDAEVYDVARALVARYATGPALALRAAKQAIDDGLETDLDTGLEIERLQFAGLFATEDQRTGMRSFVENGPGKATFAGQ